MDTIFPKFVDPYTKRPLQIDAEGNLCLDEGKNRQIYKAVDGSYNFVRGESAELEHYDSEYHKDSTQYVTLEDVKDSWHDDCAPWYNMLLESLGDLAGKKILLVGAGRSCKEFYFAMRGADVVFTDLSFQGVLGSSYDFRAAQSILNDHWAPTQNGRGDLTRGSIQFHAADANHLPFADASFDIVYGAAFVHHLDEWLPFLQEVHRVLNPGGICRFWDQADSRLWSFLKRTVFWPLKIYSYWRQPRSEGDLRADRRGGFNRENLHDLMKRAGFQELYFNRQWFFLAVGWRHIGKTVNWNKRAMRAARPILHCLRLLDSMTVWCHRISDSRLALIWGFQK